VDPYNGQIERDPDILSTFNAQKGVRPKDLIFVGNSNQIISPVMKRVLTFTLFCLCSLFILGVVAFFKRKKLGRWTAIDWILCWLSAILFYITGVIAAFAPSRVDIALLALSSCVMVFVLWLVHRDLRNMMGVDNNKGIPQVSAKSLPNFSMVGGMEDVKKEISNTVGILLRQPGYAAHFNLNFNGVLFYGPAGVGKSLMARATAGEFGLNLVSLRVSDMTSSFYGGSVKKIEDAFAAAAKNQPCMIFIDELESVGGKRSESSPLMEDLRITNQLLHLLEDIRRNKKRVFVFAATNRKEDLDDALIRHGRFDKHIYIGLPDLEARKAIIKTCLTKRPVEETMEVHDLSLRMEGLNAAAIESIINSAALLAIQRALPTGKVEKINREDFLEAIRTLRHRRKHAVRESRWTDFIFDGEIRTQIERLIKQIENPEWVRHLGIRPPKGCLLYGPPGTGKTSIARVIAYESQASFFSITTADIFSKWVGESERNVRKIFEEARNVRPSIIFIDEIDSLLGERGQAVGSFWGDRVVSLILQEIDGLDDSSGIFIIGATNRPDMIESALLRGGRLALQVEIPLPTFEERKQMFHLFLSRFGDSQDLDFAQFSDLTTDHSGADIREICDRAILDTVGMAGVASHLENAGIVKSIKDYKRSASVYKVPAYLKKSKIGFTSDNVLQ